MNPTDDMPALDAEQFATPEAERFSRTHSQHAPRILLLYGSLRKRSFSRLVIEESARLLERMGAEVRIFKCQMTRSADHTDKGATTNKYLLAHFASPPFAK